MITFYINSQKNLVRGESIYMESTCLDFGCPVRAEAEHFFHLCFNGASISTSICTYFPSSGILGRPVTSQDVVAVLLLLTANIGFLWMGFHLQKTVPHFLHSGGPMTLHHYGIYDSTINAIGWCRSKSFLIYVQGQFL